MHGSVLASAVDLPLSSLEPLHTGDSVYKDNVFPRGSFRLSVRNAQQTIDMDRAFVQSSRVI